MITDLPTVKSALQINGKDEAITAWIPLVEKSIREYCNLRTDEEIPSNYEANAIKMIQFNLDNNPSLNSKSVARLSYAYKDDYPPSVYKGMKRRVKW